MDRGSVNEPIQCEMYLITHVDSCEQMSLEQTGLPGG